MARHDAPMVAGLVGSRRAGSHTRTAMTHCLGAAADAGAETVMIDLGAIDLPVYDPDANEPDAAEALTRTIREADAVVLGTPMYHGSYSGAIKNAMDYCGFDEFEQKTVGLLAVSGGSFPITALEHLRSVCRALDAWVLPYQAAVPNSHNNFRDGTFVDPGLQSRVETLGDRIVRYARIQEIEPSSFESQENVGASD